MNREIRGRVNVSPEEVERYYERTASDYATGERVTVRDIFFRIEPADSDAEVARIRGKADEVRQLAAGRSRLRRARRSSSPRARARTRAACSAPSRSGEMKRALERGRVRARAGRGERGGADRRGLPHPARRRGRAAGLPIRSTRCRTRSARRSTRRRWSSASRIGCRRTCASGITSRCSTESGDLPRVRHPRHRRPRLRRRLRAAARAGVRDARRRARARRVVSVGRDCRLTSDALRRRRSRRASRSTGVDVLDLGVCPTPLVYFSLFHWELDGGIQVTGSHNPADYNGFKLCLGTRGAARRADPGPAPPDRGAARSGSGAGRIASRAPSSPPYQDYVVDNVGPLGRRSRVVVDAGNGTAGPVAPGALPAPRRAVTTLFCDLDGRFPNHHPDPTVRREHAAPDRARCATTGRRARHRLRRRRRPHRRGRRRAAASSGATSCWCCFARDVLARNPGATIVSEVKCSQRLYDDIARHGGTRHHVEGRALAAQGEDARDRRAPRRRDERPHLLQGALLRLRRRASTPAPGCSRSWRAPARRSTSCSPTCRRRTPRRRSASTAPTTSKFAVADRVRDRFRAAGRDIIDVDGVRVRFPHGWGLLRASNTQPVLVMRFEAETPAQLAEYRAHGRGGGRAARRDASARRADVAAAMAGSIVIRGAREHNLQNIDVEIPRDRLVVVTGLSGSGKSSLAFDTLYAEGQRRYVESLSAYARQFLEQMEKPDCDAIEGLSPAIAIEQKGVGRNPRSTVGTVTEIADYLRLLFARVGHPLCSQCGARDRGADGAAGRRPAAGAARRTRGSSSTRRSSATGRASTSKELDELRRGGFVRVRIDGALRDLADDMDARADRAAHHRGAGRPARRAPRASSAGWPTRSRSPSGTAAARRWSRRARAGRPSRGRCSSASGTRARPAASRIPELAPRFFSFNSPHGACPTCGGLGVQRRFDPALVVPRPETAAAGGARTGRARALPGLDDGAGGARARTTGSGSTTPFADAAGGGAARAPRRLGRARRSSRRRRKGGGTRAAGRSPGIIPLLERRQRDTRSTLAARGARRAWWPRRRCPTCDGHAAPARGALRARRRTQHRRGLGALDRATRSAFLDGLALGAAARRRSPGRS